MMSFKNDIVVFETGSAGANPAARLAGIQFNTGSFGCRNLEPLPGEMAPGAQPQIRAGLAVRGHRERRPAVAVFDVVSARGCRPAVHAGIR